MERLIIVSNRLPLSLSKEDGEINIRPSIGGLATGMKTFYKSHDSMWIGWPGIDEGDINSKEKKIIKESLEKEKCVPIYINKEDIDDYYYGYSNKTVWPLFHYFMQNTVYDDTYWDAYVKVNQLFADEILSLVKKGDNIWVHDYHLLLLPHMIRKEIKEVSIGFFLHIPFPSYEVFRILPWRREILEGMLGADLVGFHTFDYERHFMSCVRRLLGLETHFNIITMDQRSVKVDNFPMGIDYDRYHNAAQEQKKRSVKDQSHVQKEIDKYFLMSADRKLILSIDRMDYSKGIPNRLMAYEYFLEHYPEFREKVTLIMLTVPSRANIEEYQIIKSEVDELVGSINGKYGTINWVPIWYFYRSMPFEDLISLYNSCDIGLITPVRDGMNLVSKEYIACKTDGKGVLILSEMAGASKELTECLIINPNNTKEVADAIAHAINIPVEEQIEINKTLQQRLKRYDIIKWANDFMLALTKIKKLQQERLFKKLTSQVSGEIVKNYKAAEKRILFLDYDGTMVNYKKNPQDAGPDKELMKTLKKISDDKNNELVIISGRDRDTIFNWFKDLPAVLCVEHGVWTKKPDQDWEILDRLDTSWKEQIKPALEFYVDRTPGTFIEEKNYSLVWHYRKADPDLGLLRAIELKEELIDLVSNLNLEILEGNKVIEIKSVGVNKGVAALRIISNRKFDFIFATGDDWTDEYMFELLPQKSHTIKVGIKNTQAKYNAESVTDVRNLLKQF